jgi:hypothetical protein
MKKALLLALASLLCFSFTPLEKKVSDPKYKYYYFCLSKEVPSTADKADKLQFIYTSIHEVKGNENDIRRLTNQFTDYINEESKSDKRTFASHLNYYPDREQAETRYKEILDEYQQTEKYDIKYLDFQFE